MEVVVPQFRKEFGRLFDGLEFCSAAAQVHENAFVVLEPDMVKDHSAITEFRKWFVHDSPNPAWFERICFEQWILIAQWMRETNREVIFKCDSDVLVFCNLGQIWEVLGCPVASRYVPDSFVTRKAAQEMSEHIIEIFRSGKTKEARPEGYPLSDQNVLEQHHRLKGYPDLSHGPLPYLTDTGLYDVAFGRPFEGHKDIVFVNGQPCWIRDIGYTKMLTLHCWGFAKKKMSQIWNQSRESLNGSPVRMAIGLAD